MISRVSVKFETTFGPGDWVSDIHIYDSQRNTDIGRPRNRQRNQFNS